MTSPKERAKAEFINSGGKKPLKDIAKEFGIPAATLSSWKNRENWKELLPGGKKTKAGKKVERPWQLGNTRAVGYGAPEGSKNALKHGLYEQLKYSEFTADEKLLMHSVPEDRTAHLKQMLAECEVRERRMYGRLEELYKNYKAQFEEGLMADSVLTLSRKRPGQTIEQIKKSVFSAILQTEEALTKLQDRKRSILDSLQKAERDERQYEISLMRLELEREKMKAGTGIEGVTIVINGEKELED